MKKFYLKVVFACLFSVCFQACVFAQDIGESGDIYLLRYKFTDSAGKKNLEAYFINWTQKKSNFPTTIITPTFYKLFVNNKEELFDLTSANLSILKYSRKMVKKDTGLVAAVIKLIKLHYKPVKHYFVVRYYIKGIDNEFTTMRFPAGFHSKVKPGSSSFMSPPLSYK